MMLLAAIHNLRSYSIIAFKLDVKVGSDVQKGSHFSLSVFMDVLQRFGNPQYPYHKLPVD